MECVILCTVESIRFSNIGMVTDIENIGLRNFMANGFFELFVDAEFCCWPGQKGFLQVDKRSFVQVTKLQLPPNGGHLLSCQHSKFGSVTRVVDRNFKQLYLG